MSSPPCLLSSTTVSDVLAVSTVSDVLAVVSYYQAITQRDYERAYGMWGDGGSASGQTFDAFRDGFAGTGAVSVEPGVPGRVEGAAGSRFVEIPARIEARTTDGTAQCFFGTYVLRRVVVDGATPAQRRWHLYSADISACQATQATPV